MYFLWYLCIYKIFHVFPFSNGKILWFLYIHSKENSSGLRTNIIYNILLDTVDAELIKKNRNDLSTTEANSNVDTRINRIEDRSATSKSHHFRNWTWTDASTNYTCIIIQMEVQLNIIYVDKGSNKLIKVVMQSIQNMWSFLIR